MLISKLLATPLSLGSFATIISSKSSLAIAASHPQTYATGVASPTGTVAVAQFFCHKVNTLHDF